MNIFDAVVLGIVEGVTEFLPISSTAHLVFASEALGLAQSSFVKSFEIMIQSGAILAVLVLYGRALMNIELLKRLCVAFVPTAIVGFILYEIIKSSLIGNVTITLWALGVGGLAMIVAERHLRGRALPIESLAQMSYRTCFLIGLAQSLAVVPGVSRAAATIVGGLYLGVARKTIVEFSFLLAVPTMLAATILDAIKTDALFAQGQGLLLAIGFITAFVTAIVAIKWLLAFVRSRTFSAFGVYRVLAAVVIAGVLL